MHRNHIAPPAQSPTQERDTGRKQVIKYARASMDAQAHAVPGQLRELREHSERHDHRVIAIIPEAARPVFEKVANGESLHAVSREFEHDCIPTPSGEPR